MEGPRGPRGPRGPHMKLAPSMLRIPGSGFTMGDARLHAKHRDCPVRRVRLRSFWIARTAVTNRQFEAFVRATGHVTSAERNPRAVLYPPYSRRPTDWRHPRGPGRGIEGRADHPVVQVSWRDATAYCKCLSGVTGRTYRLPTDAEWERAARGPEGWLYPYGNRYDPTRENVAETGIEATTPVGSFPPGWFELYDLGGNVEQLCADAYPERPGDRKWRCLRGAAYVTANLRPSAVVRSRFPWDAASSHVGFRLARDGPFRGEKASRWRRPRIDTAGLPRRARWFLTEGLRIPPARRAAAPAGRHGDQAPHHRGRRGAVASLHVGSAGPGPGRIGSRGPNRPSRSPVASP